MDLKFSPKSQTPLVASRGFGVGEKPRERVGFLRQAKKIIFVSIFCLMLVSLICVGLFIWQQSLNNQRAHLEQKVKELSEQKIIDEKLKEEMLATAEAIKVLKNLLNEHIVASRLFDLVEKNTLTKVQWTSLDFSSPQFISQGIPSEGLARLSLEGITSTYLLAGRQLRAFEQASEVRTVQLSGLSESDEGVGFSLEIELDPQLFLLEIK